MSALLGVSGVENAYDASQMWALRLIRARSTLLGHNGMG